MTARSAAPATPRAAARHAAALVLVLLAATAARAARLPSPSEEAVAAARARLVLVLDAMDTRSRPSQSAVELRRRGRALVNEADRTGRRSDAQNEELVAQIDAAREELRAVMEAVEAGTAPIGPAPLGSPYLEVVSFRDVAEDVESVRDGLATAEYELARDLIGRGEALVAQLHQTRESDHVARDRQLQEIRDTRDLLLGLWRRATDERREGHPFVAQRWSGQAFTMLTAEQGDLAAVRTRFLPPQSAYVAVTNRSAERRGVALRLEFFDVAGSLTGEAETATGSLEQLRPGETRELFLFIDRAVPQFWELTRTFTLDMQ